MSAVLGVCKDVGDLLPADYYEPLKELARLKRRYGVQESMANSSSSQGFLGSLGEKIGGLIADIPAAVGSFFSGLGSGAGVDGAFDWILLILGISLLVSVVKGVKAGRVLGPVLRGFVAIALLGWAVA